MMSAMSETTKKRNSRRKVQSRISTPAVEKSKNDGLWVPEPPPLSWWRFGGLLAVLCVIPYVYIIPKTQLNIYLVVIISLNPLVRTFFPSQYVPARHGTPHIISHPCLARFLATIAEPIFLWAEAMCIGVPYWRGPMGILTIIGESISWVHLLTQSELIGWIEDCTWMSVQVAAFSTGSGHFLKFVSIPFLLYTTLFHQPRQLKRVLKAKVCAWWSGSKQEAVDADTFVWIVPSLLAQQVLFTVFLLHMNANNLDFLW